MRFLASWIESLLWLTWIVSMSKWSNGCSRSTRVSHVLLFSIGPTKAEGTCSASDSSVVHPFHWLLVVVFLQACHCLSRVIAVGYEARAFGVSRGMMGDDAVEKCPHIHLFRVPELDGKADLARWASGRSLHNCAFLKCFHSLHISYDFGSLPLDIYLNYVGICQS